MSPTTEEAQFLIKLAKRLLNTLLLKPDDGVEGHYPAAAVVGARQFMFRVRPAVKNPRKASYALLYDNIMLLRLDTEGPGRHTNSDGHVIPRGTPHLHVYNGRNPDHMHDALPLPADFANPTNFADTLRDFLRYAEVVNEPDAQIVEQGRLQC